MKAIPILVMLVLMIGAYAPAAFAATDFTLNWSSSGSVAGTFNSGDDAIASMTAIGNTHGQFYAKDSDDNPYTYGVDTTQAQMKGAIDAGGFLDLSYSRTDSKTSSYGPAGQQVYSSVGSTDTGYLEFNQWSNYAVLTDAQCGFSMTNFGVTGSSGAIYHSIADPSSGGALVSWVGSGTAAIKLQGEKAGQNAGFNMGCLPVCGDNEAWDNNYAKFTGSGTGTFTVSSGAENSLFVHEGAITIPGDGTLGSTYYNLNIGYSGAWTYPDFGLKGN